MRGHNCFLFAFLIALILLVSLPKINAYDQDDYALGKKCLQLGPSGRSKECGDAFICRNGTCVECYAYTDCWELGYMCSNSSFTMTNTSIVNPTANDTVTIWANACRHKDLFNPNFNMWDGFSSATIFISSAISSSAGTGGGGLYVPLLTTLGQFSPTLAIPLSKALVFGSSITNFVILFFQRHPKSDRPLIYYDAALLLEPVTLGGTVIGVLLNTMFPEWLIVVLLIILLTLTTFMTFKKGLEVRKKEAKEIAEEQRKAAASIQGNGDGGENGKLGDDEKVTSSLLGGADYGTTAKLNDADASEETAITKDVAKNEKTALVDLPDKERTPKEQEELDSIIRTEKRTPVWQFISIWVCWLVVLVLSIFKGGEGAESILKIPSCSPLYWFLTALPFPLLFTFSGLLGWRLRRLHRRKVALGYRFIDGDIEWKGFTTVVYPGYCIVAGIAAGLLGIGGGMLKGPLLLDLGALPQVAAATSSFMILLTSASTTAQFIILGRLKWDYALWYAAIGAISSVIGQFAVNWLVVKYKKTSFIIFTVSIVTFLSTLMMGGLGIYNTVVDIEYGEGMGFTNPCQA